MKIAIFIHSPTPSPFLALGEFKTISFIFVIMLTHLDQESHFIRLWLIFTAPCLHSFVPGVSQLLLLVFICIVFSMGKLVFPSPSEVGITPPSFRHSCTSRKRTKPKPNILVGSSLIIGSVSFKALYPHQCDNMNKGEVIWFRFLFWSECTLISPLLAVPARKDSNWGHTGVMVG